MYKKDNDLWTNIYRIDGEVQFDIGVQAPRRTVHLYTDFQQTITTSEARNIAHDLLRVANQADGVFEGETRETEEVYELESSGSTTIIMNINSQSPTFYIVKDPNG